MSGLTRMSRVTVARIGFVVVFVVVAAIGWFAVIAPRIETASDLQAQAADTELANLRLMKQVTDTRALLADAPAVAKRAQDLLEQMPQSAELPEVLDQITAAAIEAGIAPNAVSSITTAIPVPLADPGTLPPEVLLAQLPVSISVTGSAESLTGFLDNLESLDRSLLIQSTQVADVAGTADDPTATASSLQVTGTMFVLQSRLPDLVETVDDLLAQAPVGTEAPAAEQSGP